MKRRDCPLFIKPANLGSSVGISRVTRPDEFERAIELAFSFDRKILVEDAIIGRELEVGVLGNDEPQASVPGEIVSHSVFYDYQEKYLEDTAELIIPAVLAAPVAERAKKVAVAAFKAVDGSGLARVDMFLDSSDQIVINEINTLPGFTSVSMYPKLWEASGLSYKSLIDRLIELAFERHAVRSHFSTDRYCS
jgi:D-alanine-D-alanine ligase